MNLKALKYRLSKKFNYFLAKHLGIVEYEGHYLIPSSWYIYMREHDDDRFYDYEAVRGLQIFPIIKKVEHMELAHDGIYRSYIKQYCKEVK